MVKSFSSVSLNNYVKETEEKLIKVNTDTATNCCCKCLTDKPEGGLKLQTVNSFLFLGAPRWEPQENNQKRSIFHPRKECHCLPDRVVTSNTVYIIDGMAHAQSMKFGGGRTFGELPLKYCSTITQTLSQKNCNEVHVISDWETSTKNNERSRQGASTAFKVKICSNATPIPKLWNRYISNCNNKTNLCDFVTTSLCQIGQEKQKIRR